MLSPSLPCLGNLVRYISSDGFILPLHLNCICVHIDMFVHIIMVSLFLFFCMLYYITVEYTSYWYFVLYLSGAYVSPPLPHCYICVCINMFVNIISMDTAICLCTFCSLLLVCATSWASCHAYFLYIIGYSIVVILIDLYSQNCIDTLFSELVITCVKTHIFVPTLSISHIFIFIVIVFCFLLLLGKLFT